MQLIVFNIRSSRFNRYKEAAAVIVAYILGGRPVIAGNSADEVHLTEHVNKWSLSKKLEILANVYSDDSETYTNIVRLQKQVKKVDSLKTKNKEQKLLYNKMAHLVQIAWKPYITFMQKLVTDYGFTAIKGMKDDEIVGYLHINTDPEKAEKYETTISNLMQLLLVDEDEPSVSGDDIFHSPEMFFFGSEFLDDTYTKPPVFSPRDDEATDITTIYLQHCFTFPYLNKLSGLDLQAVRNELLPVGAGAFCRAMDDWCYKCFDGEAAEIRLSTFNDVVLPAAAILQSSIQNNETLQRYHSQQDEKSPIEVWIGEVPVLLIWQFYRDFEALQDATWQKLETLKDDPAYHNQRWPVMMLKAEESSELDKPGKEENAWETKEETTIETNLAEDDIKPVKKFLSID